MRRTDVRSEWMTAYDKQRAMTPPPKTQDEVHTLHGRWSANATIHFLQRLYDRLDVLESRLDILESRLKHQEEKQL